MSNCQSIPQKDKVLEMSLDFDKSQLDSKVKKNTFIKKNSHDHRLCMENQKRAFDVSKILPKFLPKNKGTKYDFSFLETSLREALFEISTMTETPIIIDESVMGSISINIVNKTLEESLNIITDSGPYDYKRKKGFYYVGVLEKATPSWNKLVYAFHYKPKFQQPGELHSLLSSENKNYITIDDKKGSLSVEAPRKQLIKIIKQFYEYDKEQPQIMLELTVTDLSERAQKQIGKVFSSGTANDYTQGSSGVSSVLNFGVLQQNIYSNLLQTITALEQAGEAEVAAKPALMTLNGEEATYESNHKYLISDPRKNNYQKVEFIESGVKLKMTPYLQRNGKIKIEIKDSSSSSFDKETNEFQEHKINTHILVSPGETVFFGGMKHKKEKIVITKVPIIGDIPGIGYFFKNKFKVQEDHEVIFTIRPEVVCNTRR